MMKRHSDTEDFDCSNSKKKRHFSPNATTGSEALPGLRGIRNIEVDFVGGKFQFCSEFVPIGTADVLQRVTTLGQSTLYSKAPTGATEQKCASSYLSPLPGLVIQRATYRWLSPTAIHLSSLLGLNPLFFWDSIRRSSGTHSLLLQFGFQFAE